MKYFLVQIQRKNGTYTKGVVIKDTLDAARQSFHAYLGAYAYGNDPTIDYVATMIIDTNGAVADSKVYNVIPATEPEV